MAVPHVLEVILKSDSRYSPDGKEFLALGSRKTEDACSDGVGLEKSALFSISAITKTKVLLQYGEDLLVARVSFPWQRSSSSFER